jgi:predicted membrane GTPase involved in stress response
MKRIVSVIERARNGKLHEPMDRREIECDDDQAGVAQLLAERQERGCSMVLILAADDSVLAHWTRPAK